MRVKVIALVMDQPENRRTVARDLRNRGLAVMELADENEARAVMVCGARPDLVVVALDSPRHTIGFAGEIKRNLPELEVWVAGVDCAEAYSTDLPDPDRILGARSPRDAANTIMRFFKSQIATLGTIQEIA